MDSAKIAYQDDPSGVSVSPSAHCHVCTGSSAAFDVACVLRKYRVQYYRCTRCGFIQAETPYWLQEAYSTAIASQDVGVMQRNLFNCEITSAVLKLCFPEVRECLDVGAGHGVFVRLMRDKGFDFFWSDRYATNDYARGFESSEDKNYDFLTAFEVLEHLVDPLGELSEMMIRSDNVFVSTCVVPEPAPKLSDWWYYVPTTGQHISFYTTDSLRRLASVFGRNLLSVGAYHLFTRKKLNPFVYRVAINPRYARVTNALYKRSSLIERDFQKMIR